ncbi:MAG: ABC transporter substrate-binding protein [Caldimonas sp.]
MRSIVDIVPRASRRTALVLARNLAVSALPLALLIGGAAHGQGVTGTIKLGVLSDFSSVYSAAAGKGLVIATKMAGEDFLKENPNAGFKVEVVSADFGGKPDIGSAVARRWFDNEGVDAILDIPNSAIAFAVSEVTRQANKALLLSGAGSNRLTGDLCSPNTVQWTYDSYSYANVAGKALTKAGNDTWFFITADYAFGKDLQEQATTIITQAGGKVLGAVLNPIGTPDFSASLVQAKNSGAKVVGLAVAGGDVVTVVKQAAEFNIKQTIATLNLGIAEVNGIGLDTAKGLLLTEPFYWDLNDETRAWTKRFLANGAPSYPGLHHAGVYAATLHYLRAVAAAKTRDGAKVVAQMKAMPTHDPLFGNGSVRADGRVLHNMYMYQVKTPAESKYPWDYYKLLATVPADQAFRPMSEGNCPLVKK